MPNDTVPATLYVEGYATSSTVRDITLRLEYSYDRDWVQVDMVTVTVLKLDLDIDSDNDDRNGSPDRSQAEDDTEGSAPGKVIIINEDDDDSDGDADNSDTEINGAADSTYDLAEMVAEIKPSSWGEDIEVALSSSNYDRVRVFEDDGTYLLGPDQGYRDEHIIQPGDLTNGILDLLVEGVETGQVTISLIYRKANGGSELQCDEVLVTVANNLVDNLGLTHIYQHKDTEMVCAFDPENQEECPQSGIHCWNCDHGSYSESCDHCLWYCARASVIMINRYYGGELSQDRLSYQYRNAFIGAPDGDDLGHGRGWGNARPQLEWALGLGVGDCEWDTTVGTEDSDWYQIADCLVSYRPLLVKISNHCVVAGGSRTYLGHRQLYILNPASGTEWKNFDDLNISAIGYPKVDKVPNITARSDEESVSAHSDEDGIIDFDEDNRFSDFKNDEHDLDKQEKDSDDDGEDDDDELKAYYNVPE